MEAKSLQVRRTVRIPWTMLLATVLIVAVLTIGLGAAANHRQAGAAATVQPTTANVSTSIAQTGFMPRGQVAARPGVDRTETNHPVAQPLVLIGPTGKPLT